MSSADPWLELAQTFRFEALGAPIPIMAAEWPHDDPFEARIFFHNEKFLDLYGDHRGRLLLDVLDEVTLSGRGANSVCGHSLIEKLLEDGRIRSVHGSLNEKRVELFAKLQVNSPRRIQSSVFDVTERMLDQITSLPGRELYFDRLAITLHKASRNHEHLSLMFLDLDGFKKANDLYGHKMGDNILKTVALRLSAVIRRHETAARIGGDEFVLVLSDLSINESLHFAQEKVIPALNAPYQYDGVTVDFIGVSVGIASFPTDGSQADELLACADEAMYRAKNSGKNRAVAYSMIAESQPYP